MRVEIERRAAVAVPHPFLHGLRLDSVREQERGAGVSETMNVDPRNVGRLDQLIEEPRDRTGAERRAERRVLAAKMLPALREDQTVVGVLRTVR